MTRKMLNSSFAATREALKTEMVAPIRLPEKVSATAKLARMAGTTTLVRITMEAMMATTPRR